MEFKLYNLSSLIELACVQDLHAWWSNVGRCKLLLTKSLYELQTSKITLQNHYKRKPFLRRLLSIVCIECLYKHLFAFQFLLDKSISTYARFGMNFVLANRLSKSLICRLYGLWLWVFVASASCQTLQHIVLFIFAIWVGGEFLVVTHPPFPTSPSRKPQLPLLAKIRRQHVCQ